MRRVVGSCIVGMVQWLRSSVMFFMRAPSVAAVRRSSVVRTAGRLRRGVQRRKVRSWPIVVTLLVFCSLFILVMAHLR